HAAAEGSGALVAATCEDVAPALPDEECRRGDGGFRAVPPLRRPPATPPRRPRCWRMARARFRSATPARRRCPAARTAPRAEPGRDARPLRRDRKSVG